MNLILALCLLFSVIENLARRTDTECEGLSTRCDLTFGKVFLFTSIRLKIRKRGMLSKRTESRDRSGHFICTSPSDILGKYCSHQCQTWRECLSANTRHYLRRFLFSIGAYLIKMPELTPLIFAVSVISGIFWSIGQMNQLSSVAFLGVSKAVPLSTGMQLVGTTLFGVIVFKEWQTMTVILIGSCAILFIIAGVVMTSLGQKSGGNEGGNFKRNHHFAHLNRRLRRIRRHFKMVSYRWLVCARSTICRHAAFIVSD